MARAKLQHSSNQDDVNQEVEVELRHFDIMEHYMNSKGEWQHPLGIYYGVRRSGKTKKLIGHLHELKDVFGTAFFFSPTAKETDAFGDIFAKCFCWYDATKIVAQRLRIIVGMQDYLIQTRPAGMEDRDLNCLIVLDDCGPLPIMKDPFMEFLASNCRNKKITLVFTIQYMKQIPPCVRGNWDFFCCNHVENRETLKDLGTTVFTGFMDPKAFITAHDFYTQGFYSMVALQAGAKPLQERIFVYESTHPEPDFQLNVPKLRFLEACGFMKTDDEIREEVERKSTQQQQALLQDFEECETNGSTNTNGDDEDGEDLWDGKDEDANELAEDKKYLKTKQTGNGAARSRKRNTGNKQYEEDVDGDEYDDYGGAYSADPPVRGNSRGASNANNSKSKPIANRNKRATVAAPNSRRVIKQQQQQQQQGKNFEDDVNENDFYNENEEGQQPGQHGRPARDEHASYTAKGKKMVFRKTQRAEKRN